MRRRKRKFFFKEIGTQEARTHTCVDSHFVEPEQGKKQR